MYKIIYLCTYPFKLIFMLKIKFLLVIIISFITLGCYKEDYWVDPNRVKIKLYIGIPIYDKEDTILSSIDIKTNDLDINYVDDLLTCNNAYPTIFNGKFFVKDSSILTIKYNIKNKGSNIYLDYTLLGVKERIYLKDKENIIKINIKK